MIHTHPYWLQLVAREDGELEAGFNTAEGNWGRVLAQNWHVDKDKIPDFLHQLSLCQSARCRNAEGRIIWLRINPKERAVRCQVQTDEEEATDP